MSWAVRPTGGGNAVHEEGSTKLGNPAPREAPALEFKKILMKTYRSEAEKTAQSSNMLT